MTTLSELAAEIAAEIQQEARALEPERLKIQARLQEIESISHAANLASHRLVDYSPKIGGQDQCPSCWIRHEVRSPMAAISSAEVDDNPLGHDAFKCRGCGLSASLEA